MVNFAQAHHPSNCLRLNNRNGSDDGDVAAPASESNGLLSLYIGNDDTINSIGCMANDRNNCKQWQQQSQQQRQQQHHRFSSHRCIINDNSKLNSCHHRRRCHRLNAPIYRCNGEMPKKRADIWRCVHATVNSSNLSVSLIFCAAVSLLLLNVDPIKAEPQQQIATTATSSSSLSSSTAKTSALSMTAEQQCEPRVLDETPPDPVS